MNFLKKLFGKGAEPFTPNPTQHVPGLDPLVVQVTEILFPNSEEQQVVFKNLLAVKNDPVTMQLNILCFSEGKQHLFSKIIVEIKNFDPYRDIWSSKAMHEWAISVIKEGKFVNP